jgi:hypothetical protein
MVVGGGFEPPKASPTDLQSVPFGRSGTPPGASVWSQRRDSNPRPTDYKSVALPAELRWPQLQNKPIILKTYRPATIMGRPTKKAVPIALSGKRQVCQIPSLSQKLTIIHFYYNLQLFFYDLRQIIQFFEILTLSVRYGALNLSISYTSSVLLKLSI